LSPEELARAIEYAGRIVPPGCRSHDDGTLLSRAVLHLEAERDRLASELADFRAVSRGRT
jgi:hypothetical protein